MKVWSKKQDYYGLTLGLHFIDPTSAFVVYTFQCFFLGREEFLEFRLKLGMSLNSEYAVILHAEPIKRN